MRAISPTIPPPEPPQKLRCHPPTRIPPDRTTYIHRGESPFFEQRFTRFECHDIAFVAEKAEEIRFAVVHGLPAV